MEQNAGIDETIDVIPVKKGISFGSLFDAISGCFAPVISTFAGAGVLKGILTLLTTYGLLDTASGAYMMINAASDSVFYFLPFVLAYTSAKKFKTNEVMALAIACIYMYPTVIAGAGTGTDSGIGTVC